MCVTGWLVPPPAFPPHSHFVNVFISRKEADRQKGKEDRGGGRAGTWWGSTREAVGRGSKQSRCLLLWFSQSVCTDS